MSFCIDKKIKIWKNALGKEDEFSLREATNTHTSFSQDRTCLCELTVPPLANRSEILHSTPLIVQFSERIHQFIGVLFNENTKFSVHLR